jgi:hypothetical protein
MTDPHPSPANAAPSLNEQDAKEMRRLLHDMNNSLEVILQAAYLLGTVELDDAGRQWLQLLEKGVDQTAILNRQFRDIVVQVQGEAG